MWLVDLALRRPFTILVLVLAIIAGSTLTLRRAPADIFPSLGVPVIYVVQPFGGLAPTQMESQVVGYYEYHFLYINGIEHIESASVQGLGMLKLYFHPGTNIAEALSQVTAMAFRATAFMPSGTLPPFIVRFDVGSVPVGQLVFSSDQRGEAEIQDLALFKVRPMLATLPGVSAPPPSGGKVRMVVAYADPDRLRAYNLSVDEVAQAIARANLTLPAGNVRIGDTTTIAATNAMVSNVKDLESLPLRSGPGPTVLLRDIGGIEDGSDVVTNVALINGHKTVYMPVTKTASASTLDVVNTLKDALPRMRAQVPDDVKISFEFDQSVYVTSSIRGLVIEGLLGAALTALTILAFLRSWRSALIVAVTIPLSILSSLIALRIADQTVNIMTLSGLALSVGILVDEATVAIENIHNHLELGKPVSRAVLDAMRQVIAPRFIAMVCILAVFIPTFFMVGISRSLFPPLALAVGFAMIASYLLTSALVPVLSTWLLRARGGEHVRPAGHGAGGRIGEHYRRSVERRVRRRWIVVVVYLLACAPAGTSLDRTSEIVRGVDESTRALGGASNVELTLANIGQAAWTAPVNAVYVFNAGPQEALLLVGLRRGSERMPMAQLQERLRTVLAQKFPDVRFSFEAGDIVSQILNFGAPTPIHVTVSGKNVRDTRAFADRVLAALRRIPELRDVQIPIALDYPTLDIQIDRERAGQLGLSVDRIGKSIVGATSSSVLTTPIFWADPQSGVGYRVQVRVPESRVRSIDDLQNVPIAQDAASRVVLRDVATVRPGTTPGEVDHFNSQRTISVDANLAGDDLGRAASDVETALHGLGAPPKGTTVAIHGQAEQMQQTLQSLRTGLWLAVVVVLLVLAANFQSVRDPLIVLMTTPAVLAGVVLALYITGTTLNVQSLMGAIMAIGVSVANSVLIVTFAKDRWFSGASREVAAVEAARSRLRPIVMTSVAMVVGMLPTALAIGEGGDQAAPLGIAVIGGLVASTLATLLVTPALYVAFGRAGKARSPSLHPDDLSGGQAA